SIELKKSSGHSLKDRKTQQFLGLAGKPPLKLLPDRAFVGERSGRAGNHAFSARDASGAAHGIVHIKCDSGAVTLPLASDYEVLAQVGTSAHTAVAQNAGGVVHQDGQGRLIFAARDVAARIAGFFGLICASESFQFAVAGMLL